ncbi:hypothetical protein BDR06DRAFT_1064676 [Suillus hirtellus]|nr:hypothetical protein BDR06DRAFT_1064676 [Suillus hirtellus]
MPCHQDIISEVGVKFVCISCHVLAQYHGRHHKSPYFGFYHDGKPVFNTFLQIHGALKLSHQAQVSAETVLFIHLNLIDNDVMGGPFKLAHDFLVPYFPNGGIVFHEVTFDVGSDSKIIKFYSMVDKLVLELLAFPGGWKRIIFGISDHTDNTFSDPFVGYEGKKKIYIATPVNTFLDIVLGPFKDLINLAVESYLWLFCCSAIVNNSESFANLKTSVLKHQLSATVAFNAFAWTHTVFHPWGQYLPVQCPTYWTSSFRVILVGYKSKFLAAKDSKSEQSCVIKKIKKAIVAAHKEQGEQVPLPSSLKKAIKKYYGQKIDDKESDEEGAAKAREISACPKEAAFYKKMLTDWDVAQRLFKQEMDEFDKAEQARKGVKDPIKFRTRHAREWFNQIHKKQANQILNVTLHESQPRNVKKSFSVGSDGIKEWTSTGFEFFAEWAKGKFYPTADQDEQDEEEHGLPELILDDEGYAQLPSCDGIRLKDQQELVHMIFHAAYKVFTGSTVALPAKVSLDRHFEFLDALSTDSSYLELVDAVKDLANMMEKIDMVMASLELLTKAPIRSSDSAALVVLGLGLILRDCKRVIEYEEDEALPGTPSYLASSIMDLQCMIKVDRAISDAASSIVGLIELAMKATSGNLYDSNQGEMEEVGGEDKDQDQEEEEDEDEDEEEEEDKDEDKEEKEKDQDQDDEQEEVTGDLDVQMQEVEKDNEGGKSKGKKRIYLKLTQPAHWLCGPQSWLARGWRPGCYKSTGGMASMASTWATGQTGHSVYSRLDYLT